MTSALRQTLEFLNIEDKDVQEAAAEAMSYFRWQHGLQHCCPVKKAFMPWPKNIEMSHESFLQFATAGLLHTWRSSDYKRRYNGFRS